MQATCPNSRGSLIMSECQRGNEGLLRWGRCTRWHVGEGTRKKNTNNDDPEDMKAERKGKQRIAGLLLHMNEGSLHKVFHRCRQTKWRKQCASLIARPYHQTLRASASCVLQRTCFGSFLFSTLFPVHPLYCFGLWSQKLWSSTRLREYTLEKHSLFLHLNKADISHTFIIPIS